MTVTGPPTTTFIVDGFEIVDGKGVYILQAGPLVKIGKADHLPTRLATIRSTNPSARLVAFYPTALPLELEQVIHERFAHNRREGEWFEMADEDLREVAKLAKRTSDQVLDRRRANKRRGEGTGSLRSKGSDSWEMRYKGKSRIFHGSPVEAEAALSALVVEMDEEKSPRRIVRATPRSAAGSLTQLAAARSGEQRWRLRYGGGPDLTRPGKYVVHSKTFTGSESQATKELARLIADVDRRVLVSPTEITVTELIERWLEHSVHQPSTARTYRGIIQRHLSPVLSKIRLSQLEPMHIERVLLHMRRSGLSDRTVQQAYSIMHAALERAFRWGLVAYNPASRVDRPRSTRHEIRLPEMRDLVRGIAEVREFDPLLGEIAAFLLFSTGLRRGELCALRWDDVDLPGRKIHVRHAVDADARSLKTPKSGQRREIPLDPLSVGLLEQRWREATRNAEQGRWTLTKESFVWTRDDTGRANFRPDSLTQDWSAATKRVGLDGVRLHDLRHGHVSLLMAAGVPIPEISKRMGHASKVMTLDVYSHFSPANAAAPTALERVQLALLRPEDSSSV